jgi:prevent-host-death family protein
MVSTKFIGVRELKQTAPELVRRAAHGERFVITRYGRPAAMLTEVEPQAARGGRRQAWEKERAAFEKMSPAVSKRFRGKYVAVLGGEVVGTDKNHDRLYERVLRRASGRVFFIGRVAGPQPVVEMPGFEIE